MATLTIKNLPDALYDQLKARAAQHRRSLNSEAILLVEQALATRSVTDPESLLADLRRGRAALKHVHLTDAELRAARESGRA